MTGRWRGNDGCSQSFPPFSVVIPAQAGIQKGGENDVGAGLKPAPTEEHHHGNHGSRQIDCLTWQGENAG